MKLIRNLIIVLVVVGFLAVTLILFQVDATEAAIITQFGQPVRMSLRQVAGSDSKRGADQSAIAGI